MKRTTSPTELLLSISAGSGVPLRTQVERDLRTAIQTGRLPMGFALPSSRTLAMDLGLSRGVVVEAYEQLLSEGYVTARAGSATRVAARPPTLSAAVSAARSAPLLRYDFRPGSPDVSLFPRRSWLMSLRRALASAPDGALGYPDCAGAKPARVAVSAYLNRARGTMAGVDQVVMCTGFAQGLRLVCQVLRERGVERAAVEDPCHAEQRADVEAMGLQTVPIPVDSSGLCVERLQGLDVGAVLVTPAHQYPTGAVLAPERRAALLEWASRRGAVVIEDDYDAEYRYDREPVGALQGLAPDRVAYLGSASKTLAPALRLGWIVLPAAMVGEVAQAKLHADRGSPVLEQLAFADFLERGEFDRHLRKARRRYSRRRDVLMAALGAHLPRLRVQGIAAGLHLMLELDSHMDEQTVVEAAARQSVRVYGAGFHRKRPESGPPALLLGYGSLPEEAITEGVRRLALALARTR